MDVAELVLDYVQALVWPALVLFLGIRFRRGIRSFLERIAGESQEFSASAFGIEVSTTFQERLASLAEESETADPGEFRESVKETAREFANEQFRELTANISEASLGSRRELAQAIAATAQTMTLDDILEFVSSADAGERLGAAIGLRVQLRAGKATGEPRVIDAIRELLNDRSSLVRYRAAEAVRAAPKLAGQFEPELRSLADTDRNREVRKMARSVLAAAGL